MCFLLFKDEGSIVGGYIKTISHGNENQEWHDSIFFFRMNFEGVFAVKRSKHNTTYFATSTQSKYNPGQDED